MPKPVAVSLATFLGLILAVIVIQHEGQVYRQTRWAARATDLEERLINPSEGEADPASPPPAEVKAPEPVRKTEVAHNDAPAPKPQDEAPTPPVAPEPAASTPVAPTEPPAEKTSTPAPAEPPKKNVRIAVEFDKDPLALSVEEERELGRALNSNILQYHRQLVSGPLQRRVLEAARPVLALRERKDLEYHFILLDSQVVNAFSHLGGYIYLNRGLFDLLADDIELQFVLAHEIFHVDQRHDIQQLSQQLKELAKPKGEGPDPLQRLYHIIAIGHTDAQEFAADAWAYRQLIHLGHTRREALSFPLRFRGYVETNGLEGGRRPPQSKLEDLVQEISNHWYALPPAMDRLDRLQTLAGSQE